MQRILIYSLGDLSSSNSMANFLYASPPDDRRKKLYNQSVISQGVHISMKRRSLAIAVILLAGTVTVVTMANDHPPRVRREATAVRIDSRPIEVYEIRNSNGSKIRAMNFGGIIISLRVPDKS